MSIEGVLEQGFVTTKADQLINYMRTGSMWPMTFGLACCAVEMYAGRRVALRSGSVRHRVSPEPAAVRRDDRRGNAVQQDGACAAQGSYDQMAEPRWVISMGSAPTAAATPLLYSVVRGWTASCGRHLRARLVRRRREALLFGIIQLQNEDQAHKHHRR